MPPWLPSVLAAIGMSIVGQAITYIILVKVLGIRVDDHDRRLANVEIHKLDVKIHDLEVRRIDGVTNVITEGLRSAGHRMNGIDQRINTMDDHSEPRGRTA